MIDDEAVHEELLRAFNEYFKANLAWKQRKTKRGAVLTRKWLSEIKRLCIRRRKAISDWQHDENTERWSSNNNNPEGYNGTTKKR